MLGNCKVTYTCINLAANETWESDQASLEACFDLGPERVKICIHPAHGHRTIILRPAPPLPPLLPAGEKPVGRSRGGCGEQMP